MSETRYSGSVPGDDGNYRWSAKFDWNTDGGYLGITMRKDDGIERVLLAPNQVRALLRFIARRGKP